MVLKFFSLKDDLCVLPGGFCGVGVCSCWSLFLLGTFDDVCLINQLSPSI